MELQEFELKKGMLEMILSYLNHTALTIRFIPLL